MKAAEDRNNKLQELLSALTESLREAKKAADAVCAHSVEIYGVDPYDVDNAKVSGAGTASAGLPGWQANGETE